MPWRITLVTLLSVGCKSPAPAPQAIAFSAQHEPQRVAARVGDQILTIEEVERYVLTQAPARRQALRDVHQRKKLVETLARTKLLVRAARDSKLDRNPAVLQVVEQALITELLRVEVDSKLEPTDVTPADVDKYLKQHPDELERAEQVRVAAIVMKDAAEAHRVSVLARGASSTAAFRELVLQHSEDPGSKVNGGALPFFDKQSSEHPRQVVDAAFSLREPGHASGPLSTDRGHYILRLEERRPGYQRSVEEVRPRIESMLREQVRARRVEELVQRLAVQYPITIEEQQLMSLRLPAAPP